MPRREALWAGGSPSQRLSEPEAAAGLPILELFRVPPRRAGFIPFRDKSLTGFNAPLGFESRYSGAGISNGVYLIH
jgi:hypothetical protein